MYIIKYSGPFGFIKPWTAVRDSETFSQQFLTPSIIEGIEKKLFPELLNEIGIKRIKRHRLSYCGIYIQQEMTLSKGLDYKDIPFQKGKSKIKGKRKSIIKRGVMLKPILHIAFENKDEAETALTQTICLARNEDIMFPIEMFEADENALDQIDGFELIFTPPEDGFKVGHNRFDKSSEMFGDLKVFGNPIREDHE